MKRIHFLDELRGLAILCMVFYHAFFTMSYFFHFKIGYQLFSFFTPAEPFFAALFILISGVCSKLSRSNLKRGLKLFAVATGVTAATYFIPGALIIFGILHMLSISMILFSLAEKLLDKILPTLGLVLFLTLFFITQTIQNRYIGFINHPFVYLPSQLYELSFLFPLGICNSEFYSADYFPLIPWMFLFLAGTFLGQFAVKDKFPEFMYKSKIPLFSLLGRNSLLIYIVHQPIIYFICWLVSLV